MQPLQHVPYSTTATQASGAQLIASACPRSPHYFSVYKHQLVLHWQRQPSLSPEASLEIDSCVCVRRPEVEASPPVSRQTPAIAMRCVPSAYKIINLYRSKRALASLSVSDSGHARLYTSCCSFSCAWENSLLRGRCTLACQCVHCREHVVQLHLATATDSRCACAAGIAHGPGP